MVLAAGALGLIMAIALAIGLVGIALVDRTNATVAADAVALADAVDSRAGATLADWYERHGYTVDATDGWASALGDRGRARSRAIADREVRVAPVVIAIVARAEQLLGRELTVLHLEDVSVTFTSTSSRHFDAVAAELGMCPGDSDTFTRC